MSEKITIFVLNNIKRVWERNKNLNRAKGIQIESNP